jgi:flagellar motility protein MotE (MotC chaperone)
MSAVSELSLRTAAAAGLLLVLASVPAASETASAEDKEAVIDYCLNISDKAAETRMSRQVAALKLLEEQIDTKLTELETRKSELKVWVERQEQLKSAAAGSVVAIYAAMEPEAAAKQMSSVDARLASSVLQQLKPKQASLILNEMKPEQAALLVKIIAAAAKQEAEPK